MKLSIVKTGEVVKKGRALCSCSLDSFGTENEAQF